MLLKPKRGHVLLQLEIPKLVSQGGIHLPESVDADLWGNSRLLTGKVVEANECIDLKVGDRVLIDKFVGVGLVIDGEEMLLQDEMDVLATFVKGE